MRFLAVLGALLGCSAPKSPPRREPVPAPVPSTPPEPYALPTLGPLPKWHLACEGATTSFEKRVIYDFATLPLYPIRHGAKLAERSRAGKPRTWMQLDEAMTRAGSSLRTCWKWAASRGATTTNVDLAFTMTPLGKTIAWSVVGKSPELVSCLQENLQTLAINEVSPRTTRMRARVQFVRVDQPPWPTPPKRPTGGRSLDPRGKTCLPVLDDAPVDQVASPIDYTVDDFDESRVPKKKGAVPTVRIGCAHSGRIHTNKADIRVAVESNRGVMQACYVDALARDPNLTGSIHLQLMLSEAAIPSKIDVTGAGDDAFHRCISDAMTDVWIPESAPSGFTEANFTFDLLAAPVVAPDAPPAKLLEAGDPDAALAGYVKMLETSKADTLKCRARAGIFEAFAAIAPWLDDPRVIAAAHDFAVAAAKLPARDAAACIGPVDELVRKLAYGSHPISDGGLRWSWLERAEAVLPLADRLAWGQQLEWFHAATLALGPRHDEGIAKLTKLTTSTDENVRDVAQSELARYELPKHIPVMPICE